MSSFFLLALTATIPVISDDTPLPPDPDDLIDLPDPCSVFHDGSPFCETETL